MGTIVSLTEVKDNLRITVTSDDTDLNRKIDIAEGLVLEFIGSYDRDWETIVPITSPS